MKKFLFIRLLSLLLLMAGTAEAQFSIECAKAQLNTSGKVTTVYKSLHVNNKTYVSSKIFGVGLTTTNGTSYKGGTSDGFISVFDQN